MLMDSVSKPNFLIAAPKFTHQSGGIYALHHLCDALNRCGYKAAIAFIHDGNAYEQNFNWIISNAPELYHPDFIWHPLDTSNPDASVAEFLANGVAVYPEIVTGNPLGAARVARYIMIHNDMDFGDDYILAFSSIYRRNFHHVLFGVYSSPFFHARGTLPWWQRPMDATYFGKGPLTRVCHKIPGTLVIERQWPSDKEQLALLLQNCRYLFSWDTYSAINSDAVLCGCVPVLLGGSQERENNAQSETGLLPEAILHDLYNKDSVSVDVVAVNEKMKAYTARFEYFASTWIDRVDAFARDCIKYFNF